MWRTGQKDTATIYIGTTGTGIAAWLNKHIPSSKQASLQCRPYLRVMDEVRDGPFEHGGGGFHAGSKDVSHGHEEVVVAEAHRLATDLRCVVVFSAALGSQQSVQQVSLHMVTVVCLMGGGTSMHSTHS